MLLSDTIFLGIRKKEFWDVSEAHKLMSDKFKKGLAHEPDGLIFQPSRGELIYLTVGERDRLMNQTGSSFSQAEVSSSIKQLVRWTGP